MKLRLLCIGKISEPWLRAGIDEYAGRLGRYLPFSTVELREEPGGRSADRRVLRDREGARLLEKTATGACLVALDERGRTFTSEEQAAFLERHMVQGTPELALVIGGPYGLSEEVKRRADLVLGLSAMTFTHQMARLILLEQLYRGLTILRGEPYHNR